ncbi:hypothetical protein [Aurantiacibacter gangjinensis]|uniref:Uncharacterized protein n=1 Tax=Aurantiacibacter gangjinensis TaxID=502682 RepID=A0A0G9MP79_9SPHN|nr:hypothetical protein [Aurantiacibacter gangjinensis]APE28286.1 hypothetical protein BMF35_a1457 [Aurantiacibacter gangjinensis]KLE32527.1 hypothetical protein AAW01_00170 [Aurantiacibacter gangjinensis]
MRHWKLATFAPFVLLGGCDAFFAGQQQAVIADDETAGPAGVTQSAGSALPERAIARDAGSEERALEMTCTHPVRDVDTADTLVERYGDAAQVGTVLGREGEEWPGVILWPDDPSKTVHVFFDDERRDRIAFIRIRDDSQWRIAGLGIGSTMAEAQAAAGEPFEFRGFGWDYGGDIFGAGNAGFDQLERCHPMFSFAPEYADDGRGYEPPSQFLGEVIVSSDAEGLDPERIRIWESGLMHWEPEGQ